MVRTKRGPKSGVGEGLSRRDLLKGTAVGAAVVGLGTGTRAWAASTGPFDPELFLLDRITFGMNEDMLNEIQTRGYQGFLDWQLDYTNILDDTSENALAALQLNFPIWWKPEFAAIPGMPMPSDNPAKMTELLGKGPNELVLKYTNETWGTTPIALTFVALAWRAMHSRRQLFYVMSDFWTNVLNTFIGQNFQHAMWFPFQEMVIHPNALGNYGDMVKASAKHASMLTYLDQRNSTKQAPIENYARELMELHTLGETAPYDENDVVAAAKIFTGWSMYGVEDLLNGFPDTYNCPAGTYGLYDFGKFLYKRENHKFGKKTVLGVDYGSDLLPFPLPDCWGLDEGEQLLDDLVSRDETAEHIARRLIHWLVRDDPSPNLVTRVADGYKQNNGDVADMLQALFDPTYFHEIRPSSYLKVRRPFNFVTAFMRGTGATFETEMLCTPEPMNIGDPPSVCFPGEQAVTSGKFFTLLAKMGQLVSTHPAPDGFPPENDAWTAALHPRLDFASDFAHDDGVNIATTELDRIFGTVPDTKLAEEADKVLFKGKLPRPEVRAIQNYLDALTSLTGNDLRRECLAMFFSTPSFQYLH